MLAAARGIAHALHACMQSDEAFRLLKQVLTDTHGVHAMLYNHCSLPSAEALILWQVKRHSMLKEGKLTNGLGFTRLCLIPANLAGLNPAATGTTICNECL